MATTKLAPVPKSKAKTAYGLLGEIRRLILAEPKRYNQHITLDHLSADFVARYPQDYPACGTVGCVAGWVVALRWPSRSGDVSVITGAREILGLDMSQRDELFAAWGAGERYDKRAHARRGAAHIAAFQQRYAAQLKATRLKRRYRD